MRKITAMPHSIILFLLIVSLMACSSKDQTNGSPDATPAKELKAKVVYFSIPGWPYCKKVTTIVDGLEKEYNGALKVEEIPTTDPQSKKLIEQYKLTTHGMLIFDENDSLAKTLDGHFLEEQEIRTAVAEVVGR